jgi:hypothetical protein
LSDEIWKISVGKDRTEVTAEQLSEIFESGIRVTEVALSYQRNIKTQPYESETVFQSMKLDLADVWSLIPPESNLDPQISAKVRQIASTMLRKRMAGAMTYLYKQVTKTLLDRMAMLGFKPQASDLARELEAVGGINGYEPFKLIN